MEPEDLARELGMSAKSLRAWLRATYPRPAAMHYQRWHLSSDQVAAARERFAGGRTWDGGKMSEQAGGAESATGQAEPPAERAEPRESDASAMSIWFRLLRWIWGLIGRRTR